MRSVIAILTAVALLVLPGACRDTDYAWIGDEPGRSILDIEYINDTLGIRLRDIEQQVLDGTTSPYAGAHQLLSIYLDE